MLEVGLQKISLLLQVWQKNKSIVTSRAQKISLMLEVGLQKNKSNARSRATINKSITTSRAHKNVEC